MQEVEEDLLQFVQEQRQAAARQQRDFRETLDTQMVLSRMQRTAAAAAAASPASAVAV
jgi:hypothetical protein